MKVNDLMQRFSLLLLYCLIAVAMLAACDSPSPTPTPILTPVPINGNYRPSINVTRADYDAAVNLWKSHSISEYEITARELSERSTNGYPDTYRVNGNQVVLLHSAIIAGVSPSQPITLTRDQLLLDNTIEGLFKLADESITDQYVRTGAQTVYDISFDPTFGYVTSYKVNCEERATPISEQHLPNCPSDTYAEVTTSDFKVLSYVTPATATPTPLPTAAPVYYKPSINITRADYDAALKLWQSYGISEYDLTSNELSLESPNDYAMIYRVSHEDVTILLDHPDPKAINPTPILRYSYHRDPLQRDNTVEGLFVRVGEALADQSTTKDVQFVYEIHFDPAYGYPIFYETGCKEMTMAVNGVTPNNCPTDTFSRIRTGKFTVTGHGTSLATATQTP